MLSLYRPGTGLLHRMPAGPQAIALAVVMLALSFLPSTWWAAVLALAMPPLGYAVAGLGPGTLLHQVFALRWLLAITLGVQLIVLAPEAALANTTRVLATILLASLLVLTTRITDLLDAVEKLLAPTARWGLDPARASLLLGITITTVPVLARLGAGVGEAQRARGSRASLSRFVVPFLVVSLKHADELGEALTARGVR